MKHAIFPAEQDGAGAARRALADAMRACLEQDEVSAQACAILDWRPGGGRLMRREGVAPPDALGLADAACTRIAGAARSVEDMLAVMVGARRYRLVLWAVRDDTPRMLLEILATQDVAIVPARPLALPEQIVAALDDLSSTLARPGGSRASLAEIALSEPDALGSRWGLRRLPGSCGHVHLLAGTSSLP